MKNNPSSTDRCAGRARRHARRRLLEVECAARPVNRDRHSGRQHYQHQEQVAHFLEQRHREDVEADVVAEGLLDDSERHAVESLEVSVPARRLALGREQREQGRAGGDDHAPRHALAERANQLGQIDLDHLVGAAHDAQPFTVAAAANRDQPADEDRAERDQPHDQEDRDFRADGRVENAGESERSVPQVIDQQLVKKAQRQQRDDYDRRDDDQDIAGPHQRALLFAPANLADVLAHDVRRAEPDEHFEREIGDDEPVELAD